VLTAWRTLVEIAAGGDRALGKVTVAVNVALRHAWAGIAARHGHARHPHRGLDTRGRDPAGECLVLCVDEKSQIQALDRTAPCLPMLPATPARMTHDYVRNGTTRLFAALDLSGGSVIAQSYSRRRHQEFLRFLKLIDKAVLKDQPSGSPR
jgi:hypothetical protein